MNSFFLSISHLMLDTLELGHDLRTTFMFSQKGGFP